MKYLFICLLTPLLAFGQDYKQYINLSYAEIDSLSSDFYENGNLDECVLLMQVGREKAKIDFGEEDSTFASYTNGLGFYFYEIGNYDKALPLFMEAISITETIFGTEHPDYALALTALALLYDQTGNYDKALSLLTQVINIQERVLGKEHPDFSMTLNNLAGLHYEMGNYDKALPLFMESLEIKKKVLGKEHPDFSMTLNNLAGLYEEIGNYDKALSLLIEAIEIDKKVLGRDHPNFTTALMNLGGLYEEMGNYDKALPILVEVMEIEKRILGTEHPKFVITLNNLANLYLAMGNHSEALNTLTLAINYQSMLKLEPTFDKAWLEQMKGVDYLSVKHIKNMIISLGLTVALLQEDSSMVNTKAKQIIVTDLAHRLLLKATTQVSNDKDKLRLLASSHDWLLKSLDILNTETDANKAFNLVDQNKSVLLLQATKSETTYRLGELPDSLIVKNEQLLKKQSQLQAQLIERHFNLEKDSLVNELNHVNHDIDDFIFLIQKKYPKYYKLKYQQVAAKVETIQNLLDKETALLEYVIGDSMVHIFLVDQQEVKWKKLLVSNRDLKRNINAFHRALSNYTLVVKDKEKAYRDYTIKAHWFYQKLIQPVLKDKQNIKNLIIIADGELGHLPFETFLIKQAPQLETDYQELSYLVNEYDISYNYSAALWTENKEASVHQSNGEVLGVAANYNLKMDSFRRKTRLPVDQSLRKVLKPLPAARQEVEMLQKKYKGLFIFDQFASEKIVKKRAPDFAILHFATHGILNKKRPMLSSLALSEDNDSLESNFWQAHEISKMKLNATNLVVLSACETGYGKFERGNGIASLARAFMYAGASSLIVSLWQVNDYATSEIMKNLYENLESGMKKDEALKEAKLKYIKSAEGILAHPVFWSPFILMGNNEAIFIKTRDHFNPRPWIIGGGGIVFILVVIGWVMYKERNKEV